MLGLVLAEGPLGAEYRAKAAAGHPYYRNARFYTRGELSLLLATAELRPVRTRSALLGADATEESRPRPRDGDDPRAGFTAILSLPASRQDAFVADL